MSDTATKPELGPIATRIVFEDERVRVWDQLIEPGSSTGAHHHALPYALVTVEGSTLDVLPVPGHPMLHGMLHGEDALTVDLEDRTAGILEAGSFEEAINKGDRPYRAILVEFKNASDEA